MFLRILVLIQVVVVLIALILVMLEHEGTTFQVRPLRGHVVAERANWVIYWELPLPNGNSCVVKDATTYASETRASVALPYLQNTPMTVVEASCPDRRCMTPEDWHTCQDWRRSSDAFNRVALVVVVVLFVQLYLLTHRLEVNPGYPPSTAAERIPLCRV